MTPHDFPDDYCSKCGVARAMVEDGYVTERCSGESFAKYFKDHHSASMLRGEREFTDAVINAIGEVSVAEAQAAIAKWRTENGST